MFNLSFYVICWLLFFLLCLPIIFAGLLAVALDKEKVVVVTNRLREISNELNKYANDKAKLKLLLDEFPGGRDSRRTPGTRRGSRRFRLPPQL